MTETNNYLIETRGLTRRFGSQLAVDSLNLQVPEAGVYGVLGIGGGIVAALLGCLEFTRRDVM